jgi:hypothetical protein
MTMSETTFWKRCSTCKAEIGFDRSWFACNVSTCNRKSNPYVFCSVDCWQQHVPVMRHRDSWAEQQRSPSRAAWLREQEAGAATTAAPDTSPARPPQAPTAVLRRRDGAEAAVAGAPARPVAPMPEVERDILIVASKLKKYIRERSGMNTSETVMEELSDRVRDLCDEAILRARGDGRKTVMDRDF